MVSPPSYLKPSESLTEIVAGLIMVLSFTLAASVLSGGGQDGARAALLGAIGCNAAWGTIDAVFYVMTNAFDRNRRLRLARAIAATPDEPAALAAMQERMESRAMRPVSRTSPLVASSALERVGVPSSVTPPQPMA